MRYGAFFAVVFLVVGAVAAYSSQPPKPESPGVRSNDDVQTDSTKATEPPTQPTPMTVTVTLPPKSPAEVQQEAADRRRREYNEAQQLFLARMLAAVGVLTAFVVGWQAWETRKAADAAQASARAAEQGINATVVLNQQWLATANWKMELGQDRVDVHFALVNPTGMAVTVTYLMVKDANDEDFEVESASTRELLPTDYYGLTVTRMLTDTNREEFAEGKLRIVVVGLVGFTDAFSKDKRQSFGALCECRPTGMEYQLFDASVVGRWAGDKHDPAHDE